MTQQNKKSGRAQSDKPVDVMAAFSKLQSAVREKSGNKPKAAGSKNSGKNSSRNVVVTYLTKLPPIKTYRGFLKENSIKSSRVPHP